MPVSLLKIRGSVPKPLIHLGKGMFLRFLDLYDFFSPRTGGVPPRRLAWAVGDGDFESIGNEFMRYFVELCHLNSGDRVLDVGCGCGRMALPMSRYLSPNGRYNGIDVAKEGIEWCQKTIGAMFPNFDFRCMDVLNGKYNPAGVVLASEYEFPFCDSFFDFAFLTSVFTHMLPSDIEHYIAEISRVLKRNGRCLATFYLSNDDSRHLINVGKSSIEFKHPYGIYAVADKRDPELAVAYEETYIRDLLRKCQLKVEEPIRFGSWSGRDKFTSYQDIVLVQKD